MIGQNASIIKVGPSARLDAIIKSANIQSRFISIGRAIVAVAQLIFILSTLQEKRFAEVGPQPFSPHCQGLSQAGLYCVVGGEHVILADVVIVFGLILVISGFYPRWTGIVHLYITYALSTAVTLPGGGESVVLIVVGLLAVAGLSDNRRNCYLTHPGADHAPAPLQSIGQAAIILGRVQLCFLYAIAAFSKLGIAGWVHGIHYAANNALFGDWFQVLERSGIFGHGWFFTVATWMPIALELLIAINVIGTANMRRASFTLAVILHGGIILTTGFVGFSLMMIGCCLSVITPPNRYTDISVLSTSADSADLDDFLAVKADIRPNRFISLFGFHQAFTRPVVCCEGVATQGRWGGDLALVKIGEPVAVRMRYKLTNKLLGHSPEVVIHDEKDRISARLGLLNGSPFKVEVIAGDSSATR